MMHMTFYWGKTVTILFDSWRTDSWGSYALSLIALFLVSAFYQYMEGLRIRFKILAKSKAPSSPPSAQIPLLFPPRAAPIHARLFAAVIFGLNSAIGYLLMLAVMSFNGGVFVAVIVGLAAGLLGLNPRHLHISSNHKFIFDVFGLSSSGVANSRHC
ncbi:hypothetical protein J5N97_002157 [Dioscorea zingiberensis]|uniref:Copper transport protein n=1 Tax=Dioscorea zingiberensis TaxID=325984 RepID=A0A9D5D273_9LILI|nr:hypothetical protein J5N97_002157 [Dioscorea zingiberensis]